MSLEYSMKALLSLQCFQPTLSRFLISNLYFASYRSSQRVNRFYQYQVDDLLSSVFVFPDPEPPKINILHK